MDKVFIVKENYAGGEYLRADGRRTPASNEAAEFETREAAETACERATDRVFEVEPS